MSRLTDLLAQARSQDPQLGRDLEAEIRTLSERRVFGLNFERHRPEAVELPERPVRKGDKVRVLSPRGELGGRGDQRLWRVGSIESIDGASVAHLVLLNEETTSQTVLADDLVVVAEFRDPIYPGLRSTGRVERGGDKPFHTVINAENFHALQTLLYTHRATVDAIYIDPPYNTGAKDWKYNNDYVDGDDLYRHSKWLAFIERRLLLAKELLNPADSVLVVTIDEKEYLRLGLLLEQTFPDARITMVTSSITPGGSTRRGTFNRAAEYLYFVQVGASAPVPLVLGDEWNPVGTKNKADLYWARLIRSGTQPFRTTHPNLFYPIYVHQTVDGPAFHSIGEPFYGGGWHEAPVPDGCTAIWPIRNDGQEGRWQISPVALRELLQGGFARMGPWKASETTVYYLKQGERKKVVDGVFQVSGHRSDGSVITDGSNYEARFVPTDIWRITSHDAGNSGSRLLEKFIPGRKFPFPKSLYAVEDTLRFFVADKPNAVVLDFFSGSGTTTHAVMRLNRQLGGQRRSVVVTNNEVSATEQAGLLKRGLRSGDPEWEALGICDYITKPRLRAAVTGRTPSGEPVTGDYRFVDEFPMAEGFEENVEFFTLTYETPWRVARNRDFAAIAPLLWLRAGSRGRRIDAVPEKGWDVAEVYGVLVDLDSSKAFLTSLAGRETARMAFVVTDDERRFQMICAALPDHVEPVRLYESYLSNFEINRGRN
ncbi:site-specific DNA-methyltransferase [Occultella aeris]|uniref:DNA methylase n=1 Tax=Occultella aeris TaxID=2761496 RepID=A0A7M4DHD3_9MICO|nr:DNA methyltransferase [Occultella aeris]VZO36326.1 DNA methylase [Occultella aeris]